MSDNFVDLFSDVEEEKEKSLFVVHNGEVKELPLDEIFDSKKYSTFKAVSYVSSPKFFVETTSGFRTVTFILGIDNSDNLNKFNDGIGSYFSHGERVNFFNELPTETKDRIISNNLKIFYGKSGVMIHDKIYLLSDEETNEYRVITGSANFSKSAFDSSNKNFENTRIDDSKEIYDLYSARFDYQNAAKSPLLRLWV